MCTCVGLCVRLSLFLSLYRRRRWGSGGAVRLMQASASQRRTPRPAPTPLYGTAATAAPPPRRTGPSPGSYGAAPPTVRPPPPVQPTPPPVPHSDPAQPVSPPSLQSDPAQKTSWMSRWTRRKAGENSAPPPPHAKEVPYGSSGPQPGSYGVRNAPPAPAPSPIKCVYFPLECTHLFLPARSTLRCINCFDLFSRGVHTMK